jgi:hypothetical protein
MRGVPANLDLAVFHGTVLVQIYLGEFQLQFKFQAERSVDDGPNISVEGYWEFRNSIGEIIDQAMDHSARATYQVHLLLGHAVANSRVTPPVSFVLVFDDGSSLTVFDDSDQYESFSIQPGDIYV